MLIGGGGAVQGTYGPMQDLAGQLGNQAASWAGSFAKTLPTCGNPILDGAITDLGSAFLSSARELSHASSATACFVTTTSGNFSQADGG